MIHTITNQNGKHIIDENILKEIKYILDKGLDYGYFMEKKISIFSDSRFYDERHTVIFVEDL